MFRAALLASAALLTALPCAHAQKDLTITWGEDSTADRTYDPRVTQSRHETQVIVRHRGGEPDCSRRPAARVGEQSPVLPQVPVAAQRTRRESTSVGYQVAQPPAIL